MESYDLKERRGYSHLKEEALDRTMWRAHFERGFGPVARQTTKLMNEFYVNKGRFSCSLFRHQQVIFCKESV
jgi:hypothetical protein